LLSHLPTRFGPATLAAVVLLTGGVAACGEKREGETLRVVSRETGSTTVDLGQRGKSGGDLYVFDADLFDAAGLRPIGRLRGSQTSIKVEGGAETVQGQLTFEVGPGDSVVVGGLSEFPLRGAAGFPADRPYVRAVLGGTGRYAGARGTVTSRRRPDGRYEQEFELLP
jgi:hypothetical protein